MISSETLDAVRWRAGWHPIVTAGAGNVVGLAIGNGLAIPIGYFVTGNVLLPMAAFASAGLLIGIGCWIGGVRRVNAGYDAELHAAVEPLAEDADDVLVARTGSQRWLEPAPEYALTAVRLGDDAVHFRETVFDMRARERVEDDAVRIPDDALVDVRYDGGTETLTVETERTDHRFHVRERPSDALTALRDRTDAAA